MTSEFEVSLPLDPKPKRLMVTYDTDLATSQVSADEARADYEAIRKQLRAQTDRVESLAVALAWPTLQLHPNLTPRQKAQVIAFEAARLGR